MTGESIEVRQSEGHFTGAGNGSIFYQYWFPETAPKALLLLVHGAGEHSGRYLPLARALCDASAIALHAARLFPSDTDSHSFCLRLRRPRFGAGCASRIVNGIPS